MCQFSVSPKLNKKQICFQLENKNSGRRAFSDQALFEILNSKKLGVDIYLLPSCLLISVLAITTTTSCCTVNPKPPNTTNRASMAPSNDMMRVHIFSKIFKVHHNVALIYLSCFITICTHTNTLYLTYQACSCLCMYQNIYHPVMFALPF